MSHLLPLHRARDRAATTALFLGSGFAMGGWAANLPRLQEVQSLSDSALGVLLLAFGLGAMAAMPLAGRLAAGIGAARVAGACGLVAAPLLWLPAVIGVWPLLLAMCALLGAINGSMDVAMNARASAVERRGGKAIMSSFHAGWSLGGLAGSLAAGALARAGWSLALSLLFIGGILGILSAVGLWQRTREATLPAAAGFALPSRRLAAVCLLAAVAFAAEGAITDWSGIYLRTELGTDAAFATTAYAAYALAMGAGRVGGDAVVRRLGPVRVVWLGSGLAGAGLLGALLAYNPLLADVGFVLAGLGLSNIVPVVFSAAGRLQGTLGVAMLSTTGYAGMLIAPPILGSVADAVGLRAALGLVLLGLAGIAALGRAVAARPAVTR
jgi:MFS family permease